MGFQKQKTMSDNTAKLLEQLAQKLGTTAEYLWATLVKQAPIESAIGIFQIVVFTLLGFLLYRLNGRFSKENDRGLSYYEENEPVAVIMVLAFIAWLCCSAILFFCLGDIVSGFFNPEYWALQQILSKISQ